MSPKQCPHLVTCSTSHSSLRVAHISEAVLHSSGDLGRPVLTASEYVLVEFSTFSNDMASTTDSLIPNMALSGSRLFPVATPKGAQPNPRTCGTALHDGHLQELLVEPGLGKAVTLL